MELSILTDPLERSVGENTLPAWRGDHLRTVAQKAAEGNQEALQTLLMEVGGPMLRTVRKVLGAHHPLVEDVAQDAALGLVRAIQIFRGECSVQHFSVRVALRTALLARRHLNVRTKVGDFSESEAEILDDTEDSPLDNLISQERRRILRSVLDQLAPPIAEAVALHFMLGMTVPEIAESEGLSANTVWSRLRLGKQTLRKILAQDGRLADVQKRAEP